MGPVGGHTPSLWLPSSCFVPGTPGNSARLLELQPKPIFPLCGNKAALARAWLSQAAVGGRVNVLTHPPRATPRSFGSQPRGARDLCQVSRHACRGRAPAPVYRLALSAPGSGPRCVFVAAGACAVTMGG